MRAFGAVQDAAGRDGDGGSAGEQRRGGLDHLAGLAGGDLTGWPGAQRGHVQPGPAASYAARGPGEPLPGLAGPAGDLPMIVHEPVPADSAFVWPRLCPVVPAAGHLCWQRGHPTR
jgi:hypothetical protein